MKDEEFARHYGNNRYILVFGGDSSGGLGDKVEQAMRFGFKPHGGMSCPEPRFYVQPMIRDEAPTTGEERATCNAEDTDLNFRAGLAAFGQLVGTARINLAEFDLFNNPDDFAQFLIDTGISFRPRAGHIEAHGMGNEKPFVERVIDGNRTAAAKRAAARLAASRITDADVALYRTTNAERNDGQ